MTGNNAELFVRQLSNGEAVKMTMTADEFRLAFRLARTYGIEINLRRVSGGSVSTGTALVAVASGAAAGLLAVTWLAGPLFGLVGAVAGAIVAAHLVEIRLTAHLADGDVLVSAQP
jgi:hypothetical protein